MQRGGVHAQVEAARELAAQVDADDVGDARVLLAFEGARHVARAVLQAELQRRIRAASSRAGCSRRATDSNESQQVARARRTSSRSGRTRSTRSNPGGTPRPGGPPPRYRRRPAASLESKACSDTDIAWPSTGSRYQPVVELQRSSLSELRCSRRLVSCHSSLRYCAPTKAAKKSSVIEPDASGAFGFSGSRSGPRSVLRLVDADVERPVFLPLEALREAEVRERARAEFGGLRVDARLDLRALPGTRAHADARDVRLRSGRPRRVRIRRTAWCRRSGDSRRRGCCAPGSRRSRPCRRASHRASRAA